MEVQGNSIRIHLEKFGLMVSRVHRILPGARVGNELSTVDFDGSEGKGVVGVLNKGAMLPLHGALGTFWIRC